MTDPRPSADGLGPRFAPNRSNLCQKLNILVMVYTVLVYLYQCNSWICQSLAVVFIRVSEISFKFKVRRVTKISSTAYCIVVLEGVAGGL